MALPKQVQAQLKEVEELEKSLRAREDDPDTPEDSVDEDIPTDTEEPDTDPATPEAQETDDAAPADTPPTDSAERLRQKYNTLRGKYDAEVPRLHEQVRVLTQEIQSLKEQLEEKQKAEPPEPKEEVSYVTDADREEFGDELLDVQRRVAREVAAEYEGQIRAQAEVIETLRSQIKQTDGKVGQMSFSQRLQTLVPDFARIDSDERWIAWLNEHDPMLRAPRRVQAQAAFDAGDAEAVAYYVGLFKQSLEPEQAPEPETTDRRAELEKQVAPNRSAGSTRNQRPQQDTKIYSQADMKRAWEKVRVLNTRGKVEEASKLEAELTAAYMQGRVRP